MTDNELIAEFMGLMVFKTHEEMSTVPLEQLKEWGYEDELDYHSNWSNLMPVVEKIESMMFQVEIHTAYSNINGELEGVKYNQDSCFEAQEETKLTVTYRAVVRFINWYNEQSKLSDLSKVIKE